MSGQRPWASFCPVSFNGTKERLPRFVVPLLLLAGLAACDGGDDADAGPQDFHVDCSAAVAGDGKFATPWNGLAQANGTRLGPGDRLLLRRGSACSGMLQPRGSGSAADPVVIGAYGEGGLPRIDAGGAATAAVQLDDMSHVILQDLELTNQGNTEEPHRGVYLTATAAEVRDVTLRRLFIHHVDGSVLFSDEHKSGGGIILKVLGEMPARFDGVLIEGNRIEDVARSGIFIFGIKGASGAPRPRATEPWPEASTGIVVRGNTITRFAGDGIVPDATLGALIEHNIVSHGNSSGRNFLDFQNRNCSAGIWSFNANNTLIQYNEVFGMKFGQSATDGCDGTAFDVDYNLDGQIVQYNYSHDNEGGFILLCSDDEPRTAEIRYNLSVNDAHTFSASPCKAPDAIGGFDGIRFYNNTIVAASPNISVQYVPLPVIYNSGSFEFRNNIIAATAPTLLPLACGNLCSHNLFFNITPSGTGFIIGDPRFQDAGRACAGRADCGEGFRLQAGSPAIGAGVLIPQAPSSDYFGNAVSGTGAPSIGFHEPGVP